MTSESKNLAADPVLEELSAYLDGELDDLARRRVEQRLASDAAYRQRLQSLQQAWDLLDELPRSETDDVFTRTTVEMVALAAEDEAATVAVQTKSRSWIGWGALAGGSVAVLVLAYAAASTSLARPDRTLVRDLPVIENVDVYRHADSVEFLRQLDQTGLFADTSDSGTSIP